MPPYGLPFRYNNIFNPVAPVTEVTQFDNPEDNVQTGLPVIKMTPPYTPDEEMSNRLEELLGKMPERNKPGILRKIVASLAGLRSIKAADQVLYDPYYREVEDWEREYKPTYQAAQLERYNNANERMLARDESRYQTEQDKLDLATRKQNEVERQNLIKEEISRKRAAAYDFKSRNLTWKAVTDETGEVWFVNPIPPHQKVRTGIKSNELNDYDKIMWAVTGRMMVEEERGKQDRLTDAADPDNNPNKPQSPNEKRTDTINRANEFRVKYPHLAKWIKIDGTNVTIHEPAKPGRLWGMTSGPTQQEYDQMAAEIYGVKKPAPPSQNKSTQQGKVPPKGKTLMLKPDGTKVWVPMEKVQEAKSKGYKSIAAPVRK